MDHRGLGLRLAYATPSRPSSLISGRLGSKRPSRLQSDRPNRHTYLTTRPSSQDSSLKFLFRVAVPLTFLSIGIDLLRADLVMR